MIEQIRDYSKTLNIEGAVEKALDVMSEEFEIKKFLIANKAEVKQMCLTEYNEIETMEMFREEGREEGGYNKSIQIAKNLLSLGIEIETISAATNLSITEIKALKIKK